MTQRQRVASTKAEIFCFNISKYKTFMTEKSKKEKLKSLRSPSAEEEENLVGKRENVKQFFGEIQFSVM
jgi:hypothetical protein